MTKKINSKKKNVLSGTASNVELRYASGKFRVVQTFEVYFPLRQVYHQYKL